MLPTVWQNSTVYDSLQLQQLQSNIYNSSMLSYLKGAERYDQDLGVHVDACRLG